jgi:hypothetical protein
VKVSELELKKAHIIKQLQKYGIKDVEGCTYNELKRRLAIARYLEVDVKGNQWF